MADMNVSTDLLRFASDVVSEVELCAGVTVKDCGVVHVHDERYDDPDFPTLVYELYKDNSLFAILTFIVFDNSNVVKTKLFTENGEFIERTSWEIRLTTAGCSSDVLFFLKHGNGM